MEDMVANQLTSSSAARTVTIRPPLGTTCANSPNFTLSLLPLLRWTRKSSMTSVFNRPPARSLERSSLRRDKLAAISFCSWERSNGSSGTAPPLLLFEGWSLSDCSVAAPFFALSFFLYKVWEFEKARLPFGVARLNCGRHRGILKPDLGGVNWQRRRPESLLLVRERSISSLG